MTGITYQTRQEKANTANATKSSEGKSYPSRTIVHAKLEMTEPGDLDEQEADSVANTIASGGKISRKISNGGSSSGITVSQQMENQLSRLQGGGHTMPSGLRHMMESGFGQDFSHVRLHTDSQAADMSSSISAKAFTHGNDIYFNRGQFSPNTTEGQRLVAHELTHVVQGSGKVGRDVVINPEINLLKILNSTNIFQLIRATQRKIIIHTDNFMTDKTKAWQDYNQELQDCRDGNSMDYYDMMYQNGDINREQYETIRHNIINQNCPNVTNLYSSYLVFDKSRNFIDNNKKKFDVTHTNEDFEEYKNFNKNINNIHYFFGHGSEYTIQYNGREYDSNNNDINSFIENVLKNGNYPVRDNDIIFLVSCHTGHYDLDVDGFAKSLSKKMPKNIIIAPNTTISSDLEVNNTDEGSGIFMFYNGDYLELSNKNGNKKMLGNNDFLSSINLMIQSD